jgi:hypothetical protein
MRRQSWCVNVGVGHVAPSAAQTFELVLYISPGEYFNRQLQLVKRKKPTPGYISQQGQNLSNGDI